MRHWTAIVLLCAVWPARADDPEPIRLTLHRARPATSSLQYRLLPELRDMQSGNAVVHYSRAMSPEVASHYRTPGISEKVDKILETPVNELKGVKIDELVSVTGLKMLEDGSRSTFSEWEMMYRARRDGIGLLLPEVQAMRGLARQLAVRTRVAIANGQFAEAHVDLRTDLAMARHVADSVTLIQGLVGMAIAGQAFTQVEAWIGQPDAPSLYWELTDLPVPFIDLRRAFEGERFFIESAVPGYRDAKPGNFYLDREKFLTFFRMALDENGNQGSWSTAAITVAGYPPAKAFLKARGWSEEQLATLPALNTVVLHQVLEYDRMFDEYLKVLNLAPREALQGFERVEKAVQPNVDRPFGQTLAGLLLPAVKNVFVARLRTDRRIASLRTVEAIRLHVTETGALPNRLDDIKSVPVPVDPLTGQNFEYSRDGATARLIAAVGPHPNLRRMEYVLSVGK